MSEPSPASPSLAIVTPSYNNGRFLDATIQSVLGHDIPNLSYAIIDGGSTDGTAEVLQRWSSRLTYHISESDTGMYDAINKGFARIDGEIMGWINSDDMYLPGALKLVGHLFSLFPDMRWLTTLYPCAIDESGAIIKLNPLPVVSKKSFARGDHFLHAGWQGTGFLQQEATFWRRSLWDEAGGRVDASLRSAGDFELWCRFLALAEPWSVDVPLAAFRYHQTQKTSVDMGGYVQEAQAAFAKHGYRKPNRWLQNRRMRLIRCMGPSVRTLAQRLKLMTSGNELTYDWGTRLWQKR